MALTQPPFIPQAWASNGQSAVIPDQKTEFGRASWSQGFPTETSIPLNAGGIPPNYLDFQGVLKALSQFAVWQQSGGMFFWNAQLDFPASAQIWHDGTLWTSLAPSGPGVAGVGAKEPGAAGSEGYWLDYAASIKYELCDFYLFRHPTLRPGFQPAQGGLLQNAATLYPEAWAYLQTTEGQKLCTTEEQWQAMTTATWATLADGSRVGWNGIGGAPYYAPNTATGALRLPDLRGMYAEAAGFGSLGVGGVHGDMIRNIAGGKWSAFDSNGGVGYVNPPFILYSSSSTSSWQGDYKHYMVGMDVSLTVPTGTANKPRAWGALACVYLGQPAS